VQRQRRADVPALRAGEHERRLGGTGRVRREVDADAVAARPEARTGNHPQQTSVDANARWMRTRGIPDYPDRLCDPLRHHPHRRRLLDFSDRRRAQKAKFGGELFPAVVPAEPAGTRFLDYFQHDKTTGAPKGIIALDLKDLP
jgi:uncharacterized protein DUF6932